MKKLLKRFVLGILVVLYSTTIYFFNTVNSNLNQSFSNNQSANQKIYYSLESPNLFIHIIPSEVVINLVVNSENLSNENIVSKYLFINDIIEINLLNFNSRNKYLVKNNINQFKGTDIIFPFHYFF